MSCASVNTRCQCCIVISSIQIPFMIKANANVVDFQDSFSLSLFSLIYQALSRKKRQGTESAMPAS